MGVLQNSMVGGGATFLVGALLMEIGDEENANFDKTWPLVGTFLAGAIGWFCLEQAGISENFDAEKGKYTINWQEDAGGVDFDWEGGNPYNFDDKWTDIFWDKSQPEVTKKDAEWRWEKSCAMCDKPATFVVEDLAVGPRGFCSEYHYCRYAGIRYGGEGFYGLSDPNLVAEPFHLAVARKRLQKGADEKFYERIARKRLDLPPPYGCIHCGGEEIARNGGYCITCGRHPYNDGPAVTAKEDARNQKREQRMKYTPGERAQMWGEFADYSDLEGANVECLDCGGVMVGRKCRDCGSTIHSQMKMYGAENKKISTTGAEKAILTGASTGATMEMAAALLGADTDNQEELAERRTQLSEKRTKMSFMRTALSFATFGLVLANTLSLKEQDEDIDKLTGMVG